MLGEGEDTFRSTRDLVERWRPQKAYQHERKFQSELKEYLDKELNSRNQAGGIMGGSGGEYVVSSERGVSRGDVVVDDLVGIELKRDFNNSQKKKLRGQLEDYGDNYPYVIACACGIEDIDGWRELKNKFEGRQSGLGFENQSEFIFIHKKKENFGTGSSGASGFSTSGGFFG